MTPQRQADAWQAVWLHCVQSAMPFTLDQTTKKDETKEFQWFKKVKWPQLYKGAKV
jgi:hypothetical protein